MRENTMEQSVLFPELFGKQLAVKFDQREGSSDGGVILLKAADQRLGLSEALAGCIVDRRQRGKIGHTVHELLNQRLYAIACGYADCNDAARLSKDPLHRLVARGEAEAQLASQPTLSRFENAMSVRSLYQMGTALADTVIERHRQRLGSEQVNHVRIDLDPTDDPTHGGQQLTFFNGHYDSWCYLPMAGFLTFNRESDQYLFCYVLRPGNAPAKQGAIGILARIIERVRGAFPKARIEVRLDGGFAGPELLDFLEESEVDYLIGMGSNSVLMRRAKRLMGRARRRAKRAKRTAHVFGETRYAAKSWKKRKRRVLIKAEVVYSPNEDKPPKDNARFVVTNLKQSPRHLYKRVYCGRGDIENRIKELHHGLEIDRTSCTSFRANQLRVLITAAAYVLMQEVRGAARGTACERAQVSTLRDRLIKLGAWIETSVRRIVLHLPKGAPHRCEWLHIARSLGAAPA